ncbi:DUF3592 domain-containing protein [Chitinophaga varians]|uniref:DUF3592 domain-containing protein n=1 Tax=Chitinophaga varians TaxID=2202339 RepID=UPI00165F6DDE|nr:DUF3592 domain-containing protein [Chitinophaga varians]MBC9909729.1 hypothetical protein [Chitinophaga varians]
MIIYLIFIVVGGLLLAGALLDLKGRLAFVKGSERAVGTVVRLAESTDTEGTFYAPVFDIPTSLDEIITYRHATAASSPEWEIGETAVFIFEPGKPDTLRFLSYWTIFWWPLCLVGVAVDLLVIGGGYFLLYGYFGH